MVKFVLGMPEDHPNHSDAAGPPVACACGARPSVPSLRPPHGCRSPPRPLWIKGIAPRSSRSWFTRSMRRRQLAAGRELGVPVG